MQTELLLLPLLLCHSFGFNGQKIYHPHVKTNIMYGNIKSAVPEDPSLGWLVYRAKIFFGILDEQNSLNSGPYGADDIEIS